MSPATIDAPATTTTVVTVPTTAAEKLLRRMIDLTRMGRRITGRYKDEQGRYCTLGFIMYRP